MEQLGDVIGRRCRELGLSQTALAERVGVHVRQIRRYERGEQQPVLGVAVRLAATLGVSLDELAGVAGPRLALDGEWWAARQMVLDGHDVVAALPLALTQHGATITAEARGAATWRGELRLWSGPVLTGWYAGRAPAGTMFFVLREDEDDLSARAAGSGWPPTGRSSPATPRWRARARRPRRSSPV